LTDDVPSKPAPRELSQAEAAHARQEKLIRSLDKFSRSIRGTQNRMQRIILFGEQQSGSEWRDHPLIQLVLERRRQYDSLGMTLEDARRKVSSIDDPDVLADALGDIVKIETLRQKHLDGMEGALATLTKDLSQAASTMAKILGDAQKLAVTLRGQELKERQAKSTRSSDISDEDINFVLDDDAPEA
jgi:hypothetical protein